MHKIGAIAFIVDLTSKPELNGIRVRLKEFIEDRQRWRAYRVDSLSALNACVSR